jgi:hypothetical protein
MLKHGQIVRLYADEGLLIARVKAHATTIPRRKLGGDVMLSESDSYVAGP